MFDVFLLRAGLAGGAHRPPVPASRLPVARPRMGP